MFLNLWVFINQRFPFNYKLTVDFKGDQMNTMSRFLKKRLVEIFSVIRILFSPDVISVKLNQLGSSYLPCLHEGSKNNRTQIKNSEMYRLGLTQIPSLVLMPICFYKGLM